MGVQHECLVSASLASLQAKPRGQLQPPCHISLTGMRGAASAYFESICQDCHITGVLAVGLHCENGPGAAGRRL